MAAAATTITVTASVRARGVNSPAAAAEVARTIGTALGAAMASAAPAPEPAKP